MLPNHSQTLQTTPVDLPWGKGTSYRLEVSDPAAAGGQPSSFEQHVVVNLGDKVAYDFCASAPTAEGLAKLQPILQQMLSSVALAGG